MAYCFILALSLVVIPFAGANADDGPAVSSFETGLRFVDLCREANPYCYGYLAGISDMQNFLKATRQEVIPNFCQPRGISKEQLRLVAIKFYGDHPELLSYAAAPNIMVALRTYFPCPTQ